VDGVSAIKPPKASTEENNCVLDGAVNVPVSRVKVLPKTHVSITISITFNRSPFVRCSVSSKPKTNLWMVLIR
jgi:hypothetical protein